mgnify:FL=1
MDKLPELEKIRHSAAHILAAAVKRLYPKAQLGIGPATEEGFYYDFDNLEIKEEDFHKIEMIMKELIDKNVKFSKKFVEKSKAKKILEGERYKLQLLDELKGKISFYTSGEFLDLCKGPHVKSSKEIGAFKLLRLAGAYWKGDSKNKMLTRIYGTAFKTKEELAKYLEMLKQAEARNHIKIGKELNLFSFHKESPGVPFFHQKGATIYNELLSFLREEYKKEGYQEVITPLIYDKALWETSGHWEHFKEDMFVLKADNREFALKPMNCPSHCLMYKTNLKSYKELPLRIADFAPLHRNELKGVLVGLTRVRKFSQDDAHIFLTEDQIESEISKLIGFTNYVYKKIFNFEYVANLSTRPEKYMGDIKLWNKAEKILKEVLKNKKITFNVKKGDGAFYGPKIDFDFKDSLGRMHQLTTIQLDFQLPKRFDLTYEGEDGKKHTPVMIHRAILGTIERFIGILIEQYAGRLPLWLSPVQVKIVTVNDNCKNFAEELRADMSKNGIRVELDDKPESIGKKIRDSENQKIGIIVTVGEKEVKSKTLAVRESGKVKFGVDVEKFIEEIAGKIRERC